MTSRSRTFPARPALALPALAVMSALLLTGCTLGRLAQGGQKTATDDATVTEAVRAVEVTDGRHGSVEVVPGSGPGVTVHRTVHYRGDTPPRPDQRVTSGVLSFTAGCPGTCYVDYRLEVPASATVKLRTDSGRLTVTGVAAADLTSSSGTVTAERVAGPLTVRTSSGDVGAGRIAGPLRIRTSSGDIRAAELSGAQAEVRSGSGDARLAFATRPASVTADTGSGDLTLRVPRGAYRIAATTSSGTRDITLPADPAAASSLSVKTTSGDVHLSAG
ncbi:DUF4097 family beta strand repeat-containing protein [Streptomyces sp. NPDC051130]|uniref:DUF4097 family beta strand repeat-containing protein n=1 Tax=Streptomyces sp. NPDC051130 TaxID=3157223 RepID=UPI00341F6180